MPSFFYHRPGAACPLCGGESDCRTNTRGGVHCRRTTVNNPPAGWHYAGEDLVGFPMFFDSMGDGRAGGPEHELADWTRKQLETQAEFRVNARRAGIPQKEACRSRFEIIGRERQSMSDNQRASLASLLCLPLRVSDLLGVRWTNDADGYGRVGWVFEERDGTGQLCGFSLRHPTNDKLREKRSAGARGLSIPDGWDIENPAAPVFFPEGATDTLAMMSMNLPAIGRPGNASKIEMLIEFCRTQPAITHNPQRMLVVVAENDRKADGTWPGKDGAEKTAATMAAALGRPVHVALPPTGFKDVRDVIKGHADLLRSKKITLRQLGEALLGKLLAAAVAFGLETDAGALSAASEHDGGGEGAEDMGRVRDNPSPFPDHLRTGPPVEKPGCPMPRGVFMRNDVTGKFRLCWFDCKRLECRHCGALKRRQYIETVTEHLTAHELTGDDVYLFWCPRSAWRNVSDRMRRQGGEYFRIEVGGIGGERFMVVASAPPPASQIAADTVEAMSASAAITRLATTLERLPLDSRVFVASHGWKTVQEEKKGQTGWRRVGKFVATKDTVLGILEYHKIEFEVVRGNNRWWTWTAWEFASEHWEHVKFDVEIGEPTPLCDAIGLWGSDGTAGAGEIAGAPLGCGPPGDFELSFD